MIIVHYIKKICSSNIFSNKLKQYLTEKWSEVVSDFNILSEISTKINFIDGNQLLLECNIFSPVVRTNFL